MDQHLSHATLVRYLSGQAPELEAGAAVSHLARCQECSSQTSGIIQDLAQTLAEADEKSITLLLARARWAQLASLSSEEQIEYISARSELQTREMFDTILSEAAALKQDDPFLGKEAARVAYALARGLSDQPEAVRNDLQGSALTVVANCRRVAADWTGSANALKSARAHLERGSGEPKLLAKLLSIHASLLVDTGHLEEAETILSKSASLFRRAGDLSAVAAAVVQHANLQLTACNHELAISRAQEALSLLTPRDARLEILARNIITASLVFLERPVAALESYLATRPLLEERREKRFELQASYQEALLLDSFGYFREAETAFRRVIADFVDADLYKDAFIIALVRFETLYRRGALAKAAILCEEALELSRRTGVKCHAQLADLWQGLLDLVNARRLTDHHILVARRYLVRHWSAPARWRPLEGDAEGTLEVRLYLAPVENDFGAATGGGNQVFSPLGMTFEAAMERHDRALIEKGLRQCGGRVTDAARLLGIARGTLRAKIKRYGLLENAPQRANPGRLRETHREALMRLRARAWWRDVQGLPAAERLAVVRASRTFHSREAVEVLLDEASVPNQGNPRRSAETASLASALVELLPPSICPTAVKHDVECRALALAGNGHRRAGDWKDAASVLSKAESHLAQGTGHPSVGAKLRSIQASLATDMGHYEEAASLLEQATALYRRSADVAGTAHIAVQEANSLLAAYRHAEAVDHALEALRRLPPGKPRLEILVRNIITASLMFLGRPYEALRNHTATLPLIQQAGCAGATTHTRYLEGLILDGLGYEQEAAAAFAAVITARMDAGLYKEAFLIMLVRFELLFRRGELDKAGRACEDAIKRMTEAGEERHGQTIRLWRDLLSMVESRRLSEGHLQEVRQALVGSLTPQGLSSLTSTPAQTDEGNQQLLIGEPPPLPKALSFGDYKAEVTRYERSLIEEALARCNGRFGEACAMLGMNPKTLRARMRDYWRRDSSDAPQLG